jgi:hypothetical protein
LNLEDALETLKRMSSVARSPVESLCINYKGRQLCRPLSISPDLVASIQARTVVRNIDLILVIGSLRDWFSCFRAY